LPPVWRCCRPP